MLTTGVRIAPVSDEMQRHVRAALISLLVLGTLACREATESQPIVRPLVGTVAEGTLTLPNRATSVKFAVIGDSGRGTPPQHEIAAQMLAYPSGLPVRVRADARRQHLRRPGHDARTTAGSSRIRIARCWTRASSSTPCSATTTIRARSSTRSSTWTASATTASRLLRISSPRS